MKLRILTILLFTIILSSCKQQSPNKNSEGSNSDCYPNSDRPTQAISYKEMASMFKEYDNGQKNVLDEYITSKTKGKDSIATISQFFNIDELKQYIAYLERLSKEKEIKLTGIKIFTAAYPSNYEKEEYQNRISFILMPTTNIGERKNVAYEPLQSSIKKPVSMQSILNKYSSETTRNVNRASMFNLNLMRQGDLSSGLNRGTLNPPHGN